MARFKLIYYVPRTHTSLTKAAVFRTGAGSIGAYANCAFTVPGTGEFVPLANANPAIGKAGGEREEVLEDRVEVLCEGAEQTREAVKALREAHPYEEVAYEVYRLEDGF